MTARILVVDDVPTNVKLLEARLMAEYFHVLTASNGQSALSICEDGQCDIVLLDVLMPEMDGFEVCRRIKENPATMHIPVVMVTALDSPEDRVRGLEAGADDFLTKPVNDLALVTRVKSLVRLKMLTDDLRMRAASGDELVISSFRDMDELNLNAARGKVVIVDDRASSYEKVVRILSEKHDVDVITNGNDALIRIAEGNHDIAVLSLNLQDVDSLRLCSHLRSLERTRTLPILVIADADQENMVSRAVELGVNDYIRRPVDALELKARIATQMKRKRYNDCLRESVQQTIEMAVKDPLTDLHNRRYFENHFSGLFEKATASSKPLSAIMCDIDHFKSVNDTYGHDVGDAVIRECSLRIRKSIRNIDVACRYGGEEFVIVMPDTNIDLAKVVAERIRLEVCSHPVIAANGSHQVPVTVSIGVACIEQPDDSPEKLLKRADVALYNAKRNGRNQVVAEAA
ncbi:MAG: PleD family two-component system response regulator [Pseudomonadota bacterium]